MDDEGKSREELIDDIIALEKRLSELQDITAKLKSSEEALRLDEARLEALLKLAHMSQASERDIANFALEEAIHLTRSEVGWMGALNEEEDIVILYNFSSEAMRECEVVGRPHSFMVKSGGLWAEPIFKRKPIMINDYSVKIPQKKGFPDGHVPLRNFLAIPVFDDGHIVAIAEVGNKKIDYDRSDIRQMTLLMSGVWRIMLRKRAEEALMESKAQAELYVDLMGHDINNMNQIALGFLEMALAKMDAEKLMNECDRYLLEKPIDALQNSSRLISNVKKLQSAKIGGLKSRLIDLNDVLLSVIKEYGQIPGREVSVGYTPASGYFIKANDLIRDVFSNLVGNAIKHSPHDRPLAINVRVVRTRGQNVDYNVTMIEDNGPGISDEKKSEIFARFEKGKVRKYLSGLGLGLVKTLVDDYSGKIWVEDRVPGDHTQGSRFVVMLPAAEPYA
jgi:signal transduction histidine kinase